MPSVEQLIWIALAVCMVIIMRQVYHVHCYLSVISSRLFYIEQWITRQKEKELQ